jgi:hypothetical protein
MADEIEPRKGREGGRWINEKPTPEEFGTWFAENMKIDAALETENYVGGVVLIPAITSKVPTVVNFRNGAPVIEDREELSYIPYAKVETRINYFWDLLDAHSEWVGTVAQDDLARLSVEGDELHESIETRPEDGPVTVTTRDTFTKPGALATMVYQLPVGFSVLTVPVGDRYAHFLCCTIRVSIFEREAWDKLEPASQRSAAGTGLGALRTGRGTKQVPMLLGRSNPYADPNSMMKAETGALGRALGFAGIFVIPGSGVATAEDMQESAAQGATATAEAVAEGNAGPTVPEAAPVRTGAEAAVDEETKLRARAGALYRALSEGSPGKAEEFGRWAQERKLSSLGAAHGAMLKGVVKKLEKLTDEAMELAQQAPPPEAQQAPPPEEVTDVPAEEAVPADAEPAGAIPAGEAGDGPAEPAGDGDA